MLLEGNKQECETFVCWLNSLFPGVIKFKYEFSTKMFEFLDLQIMIEEKKLETNMFIKPSNQQLYLDFLSHHPNSCKEGVVFGQALQIFERCSKPEDTEKHIENVKTKLNRWEN